MLASAATGGMWAAALAALVLLTWTNLPGTSPGAALLRLSGFIGLTAIGVAVGLYRAWSTAPDRVAAARRIDDYYAMRDRTLSACAFLQQPTRSPAESLQVHDTALHLRKVSPADCIRLAPVQKAALYRSAFVALSGAVAVGLPAWQRPAPTSPDPRQPAITAAAAVAGQVAAGTKPAATEAPINAAVEEITLASRDEAVDKQTALEALSSLQQQLLERRDALAAEQHARQLKQIAAAFRNAEPLQAAAEAIDAEQWQDAAERLENADPEQLRQPERRAVAKQLGSEDEPNQALPDSPQQRTQAAQDQLRDGLQQQDAAQARQGLERLAQQAAAQQELAEQTAQLDAQLEQVARAKGQVRGDRPGDSEQQSDRSSDTWGKGTAGDPAGGEDDRLQVTRQREEMQIDPQEGSPPGRRERTIETADAQSSQRSLQMRTREFQQQSEQAIAPEDLPVGHRETIRRYFEAIPR